MNYKKLVPIFLVIAILIGVIAVSSKNKVKTPSISNDTNESTADVAAIATADSTAATDEMRGVWVSYMELSMENEDEKSEQSFRNKFNTIVQCCKGNGFNTLVVQVRPFCDALYKSEYFPWSHILTGVQGENPGYDPLEVMCKICKMNNLKIHAWVNPYRVSTSNTPSKLAENNPYRQDKTLGIVTDSGTYLDPSNENARELIINGIEEIVNNYDVDAIQFDDYFYPVDIGDKDKSQYQAYVNSVGKDNSMSIDNWRTANVNMLVCDTYRKIHSLDKDVNFGISPQGNIDNNESIYADVKSWCTCEGFIDYICPQIYFSLDNPALTFENSLKSWSELDFADNVSLYIGLAGYKAGTNDDENTWLEDDDILAKEYEMIKSNDKAEGFMLYSYNSITAETSSKEINNLTEQLK